MDVSLRDELDELFRTARQLVDSGDADGGVRAAENAWEKLPEKKFEWDVSKSYAHALALIYRDTGRFTKALGVMSLMFASGTVKSYQDQPYFVTGTIYFEMGDMDNARKWLKDADRISKGRCFRGESEKYRILINRAD